MIAPWVWVFPDFFFVVPRILNGMVLLYILLTVYILAVNFYSFRLVKTKRDELEAGGEPSGDGKLLLAAVLGGATAIYACMFAMQYRLGNLLLMIAMPVLAVLNIYGFYLGYRSVWLFL